MRVTGRPRKRRCCRFVDDVRVLKPRGLAMRALTIHWIAPDQFEAMRLCDLEGLSQIEAGQRMQVSRGTIQRLLESGRRQVVLALLGNEGLGLGSAEGDAQDSVPLKLEENPS